MEKEIVVENVRSSLSSEDDDGEQKPSIRPRNDPNWRPGFVARFPWVGFVALVTVMICCAASAIVLYMSNGVSQTDWPRSIAPNVLLNIMNNIANICFTVAIGNSFARDADHDFTNL